MEFTGHVVSAFIASIAPTKTDRVKDVIVHMGPSVFFGVTIW